MDMPEVDLKNRTALVAYLENKEKSVQFYITEMRKYSEKVVKYSPHWEWMSPEMRDEVLAENLAFAEKAGKVLANIRSSLALLRLKTFEKMELELTTNIEDRKHKIEQIACMIMAQGIKSSAFTPEKAKELTKTAANVEFIHKMIDLYPDDIKREMKRQYQK